MVKKVSTYYWSIDYEALALDVMIHLDERSLNYEWIDRQLGASIAYSLLSPNMRYGNECHMAMASFFALCDLCELRPGDYLGAFTLHELPRLDRRRQSQ